MRLGGFESEIRERKIKGENIYKCLKNIKWGQVILKVDGRNALTLWDKHPKICL